MGAAVLLRPRREDESISYPHQTPLDCGSDPFRADAISTAYSAGRPTAVPGFASSITYNGNGTLSSIKHANGLTFVMTPDPDGIARPGSIRVDAPSGGSGAEPWPQEDYHYDGSGN